MCMHAEARGPPVVSKLLTVDFEATSVLVLTK